MSTPSSWADHGCVAPIAVPPSPAGGARGHEPAYRPDASRRPHPVAETARTARPAEPLEQLTPDERRLLGIFTRRRGQIVSVARLEHLLGEGDDAAGGGLAPRGALPPRERCARTAESLRGKLPCAGEAWHLRAVRGQGYVLWPI